MEGIRHRRECCEPYRKEEQEMRESKVKADQYAWARPGEAGSLRLIRIDQLQIDHSYQRNEVSEKNTIRIARDFRWAAFGTLVVMERADGTLLVVDGQQRLLGAKRRGDISEVPCIVFSSDGPQHEAKAYLALNTNRLAVSAVEKFKARLVGKESPEMEIAAWLAGVGLFVTSDGTTPNGISFPTTLIAFWKVSEQDSKAALQAQRAIVGPQEPMSGMCHMGIWWCIHQGVNVANPVHIRKLSGLGGRIAMLRAIRVASLELGRGGAKTCGLGILSLLNKGRKGKKLFFSEKIGRAHV